MTTEQANQLKYIYNNIANVTDSSKEYVDVLLLGNSREIDITPYVGAGRLAEYNNNDFFVVLGAHCMVAATIFSVGTFEPFTYNYNSSTGIITVSGGILNYTYSVKGTATAGKVTGTPAVYLKYKHEDIIRPS